MMIKLKPLFVFLAIGIFCSTTVIEAKSRLNTNELEVIAFIEKGVTYKGKHYVIPRCYINQGINYLKQEGVDLTNQQKNRIYKKISELTLQGIKKGYLVLEKAGSNINTKDKDSEGIPDLIKNTKDLTDNIGIKVKYDAEKHNFSIVNEKGRAVMDFDNTIKNTGYRLYQTAGVALLLIVPVIACFTTAYKNNLFSNDNEKQ